MMSLSQTSGTAGLVVLSAIPGTGKATGRFSSIYERVFHHYHDRLGLEMPFAGQVLEKIRPERWQTAYASWGTLMHAGQPVPQRDKQKGGENR